MKIIKALNNNIYAKIIVQESKTGSGIFLGNVKTDMEIAQVIASSSSLIQVGDMITFNKNFVSRVNSDYVFINEVYVAAIVENNN